jgi:hypothetical protein
VEEYSLNESRPWYTTLLDAPNLCLIGGILLLFCAFGEVKVGNNFEFHPSQDLADTSRLIFMMMGIILGLAGATLHLNRAGFWQPRLGWLYFVASLVLVAGTGFFSILRPRVETELRVFRGWRATRSSFEAQIETVKLKRYQKTNYLLLVCRKNDDTLSYKDDSNIQKSKSSRYIMMEQCRIYLSTSTQPSQMD